MRSFVDYLLIWIGVTILSFGVTYIQNVIDFNDGKIYKGNPVNISKDKYHVPIQIDNFSEKSLSNIKLTIPKYVNINEIKTSFPLSLDDINNTQNLKRKVIVIGSIPEMDQLNLLIPINNLNHINDIEFINANSKNIAVSQFNEVTNPLLKSAEQSAFYVALNSVVYALLLLGFYLLKMPMYKRLEELREDHKKQGDFIKELRTEQSTIRKHKYLLISRLSDYSKELCFWRDTVRKLLYERGEDKKFADEFLNQITKTLKTYGTLSFHKENDFELVRTMIDKIKEEDKSRTSSQNNNDDETKK